MERLRMTPADFGLKVRQSPLAIRVTAANKMRTATALTIAQDYGARHVEGHSLVNSADVNARNTAVIKTLLDAADKYARAPGELLWKKVPAALIMNALRSFEFSPSHPDLAPISDTSLLLDYVADRARGELAQWDVAIPQLRTGEQIEVAGVGVRLRQRRAGLVKDGTYRVNGQKNRVADKPDVLAGMDGAEIECAEELAKTEGIGAERAACTVRSRPLLLIHIFQAQLSAESGSDAPLDITGPVVTFSVALPGSSMPARSRVYQVNAVYRRQLQLFAAEQEDDDSELINGDDDAR
jgi:hypothetical protein